MLIPTQAQHRRLIAALVFFILPLSGLGIDIYVPSLPAISHYFVVNQSLAQLTVTAYMLGLGVMQLFAGSISDSFGRRKPFLAAQAIFILSVLAVPSVQDIYQLLVLRLIQGISVAVAVVPMRSIIADLYPGRAFYKMANYMTITWSIGPIIAPAIGGYLQDYYGWKASFYFLACYSTVFFILAFMYLPETSKHFHPFHVKEILARYKTILFNRSFLTGLVTDGMLYSFVILFSVISPFLIQTVLHYSPITFGHVALLMGVAWFLGAITNRFVIDANLYQKGKICFWIMFTITLFMFALNIALPLNLYAIVMPMFCLLWVGGVIFPNYFARCISLFPTTTGSANSLFGAFIFLISGASSAIGTLLKSTSMVPLLCAYLVIISLCLLLHYTSTKKDHFQLIN